MHSDWWKIYALSDDIEASLNGSRRFFPVRVGSGLQESIDSQAWENIIFRNNTAAPVTLTLLWGRGQYLSDDQVSIANPLFTLSESQIADLKSVSSTIDPATVAALKTVNASIVGDMALDAATQTNLKSVTASTTPIAQTKAVIIAERVSDTNKTFADCINLAVYNSGTGEITVAGLTLQEEEGIEFSRLEPGRLYSDITIIATGAGKEATVTGSK
tara:strand:+ start:11347 stop:11994 length:648 start_codon:yes stop_codon:yes gene_type:complete